MPTVEETAASQGTPLSADLAAGLGAISANATVTFTLYLRVVLPLDGFVFWVNAGILSKSAALNAMGMNTTGLNQAKTAAVPAPFLNVSGSFHYSEQRSQLEDETITINRVIFTAKTIINDLDAVSPNKMYIGTFNGQRFAFSRRGNYYRQANLYHYDGDAIYPAMESQIIDSPGAFDRQSLVVSNSLPIWLFMNQMAPQPWNPPRLRFPIYPSFAVPNNEAPPYATIHIPEEDTQAIGMAPFISANSSHSQLTSDKVRITFYGLRNDAVMDFMDAVAQFSLDTDLIGFMNSPVPRDAKRTQSELGILAMKKTALFEVNYYQTRINDFAQQLIKKVVPTITVG